MPATPKLHTKVPAEFHRLVALKRSPCTGAELAQQMLPLLKALSEIDSRFASFWAYDAMYELTAIGGREFPDTLLRAATIEWFDRRPPNAASHKLRMFNGSKTEYSDLCLAWIDPSEPQGVPGVSVELRIAHGEEIEKLLRRAFDALIGATSPEFAFAETCFQSPRAPERAQRAQVGWLTFVPSTIDLPEFQPSTACAEVGGGHVVAATPTLDNTPQNERARHNVEQLLLPRLIGGPVEGAEPINPVVKDVPYPWRRTPDVKPPPTAESLYETIDDSHYMEENTQRIRLKITPEAATPYPLATATREESDRAANQEEDPHENDELMGKTVDLSEADDADDADDEAAKDLPRATPFDPADDKS